MCKATDLRVSFSKAHRQKRGEDQFIVHAGTSSEGVTIFGVCDGHHGKAAASFVSASFAPEFMDRFVGHAFTDVEASAASLRDIVAATFVALHEQHERSKKFSGTTLTVAILVQNILTVANIGDGLAFLDMGSESVELTVDHRLEYNEGEQQRLREAGARVGRTNAALSGAVAEGDKGIGKVRVWDRSGLGGLRFGRCIGASCMGRYIIAHPHVRQVALPPGGARLLLATDGLWDALAPGRALSLVRNTPVERAAERLCRAAHRGQGNMVSDDISVLVVDFLPASAPDWPAASATLRRGRPRAGGVPSWLQIQGCFAPPPVKDSSQRLLGFEAGDFRVLGDVDTWREHVARGEAATRKNLTRDDSAMQTLGARGDGAAKALYAPAAPAQPVGTVVA